MQDVLGRYLKKENETRSILLSEEVLQCQQSDAIPVSLYLPILTENCLRGAFYLMPNFSLFFVVFCYFIFFSCRFNDANQCMFRALYPRTIFLEALHDWTDSQNG